MTASLRLLCTKSWPKAVDLSEGRGGRFTVELAGLCQVGLLIVEVINLEKRRRAFAGGGRKDRRIAERKIVFVQKIPYSPDHRMTDFEDRVLAARAQPQVAMIHQKFRAV